MPQEATKQVVKQLEEEEEKRASIERPELSDDEEEIQRLVIDFMQDSKVARNPVDRKWATLEAQYIFFSDWANIETPEWRAEGFSVPITFAQVETALAATVGEVPGVRFIPANRKHFDWVRFLDDAYKYDARHSGMSYEWYLMKKDALKVGIGVGKRYYTKDERT